MSRHYSHLNTAQTLLTQYDGEEPFVHVLKRHFRQHKKYGSKDRRRIRALCYAYFRGSRLIDPDMDLEDKIILSYLLSISKPTPFLSAVKPDWETVVTLPLDQKLETFDLDINQLYPAISEVEEALDRNAFVKAHLQQPQLFLRVRPGRQEIVTTKLQRAGIEYEALSAHTLALANITSVNYVLHIDHEVVIQDWASQQVRTLLEQVPSGEAPLQIWDCCAASGGKSILAVDVLGPLELSVSDLRTAILQNLKKTLQAS